MVDQLQEGGAVSRGRIVFGQRSTGRKHEAAAALGGRDADHRLEMTFIDVGRRGGAAAECRALLADGVAELRRQTDPQRRAGLCELRPT